MGDNYENSDYIKDMAATLFNDSPYQILNNAYPGIIKPWELKKAPISNWDDELMISEALTWLFNDRLNWSIEDIKSNVTGQIFIDNGLSGLLYYYGQSTYRLVDKYTKGAIKPWELKKSRVLDMWTKKSARQAIKWLFEDKLKWTENDIKNLATQGLFYSYGLEGMLRKVYGPSYKRAIMDVYPHI